MNDLETEIVDVSYEGAGVGKINGVAVFVPKSLPGERLKVEIQRKSSRFLIGKVKNVMVASENRIKPTCPYFENCDGCDFQHCTQACEKQLKIYILKKEIEKAGYAGSIDFEDSNKRLGYRNKVKFEVKNGKLGYFKSKSHDFFEVQSCPIVSQRINEILPKIRDFLTENSFENLKNVYIKEVDANIGICFLFAKNAKNNVKKPKKIEILSNFDVFFAFGEILESDKTEIFCIGGNKNFDMRAFSQVNDFVAEKLYENLCNLAEGKTVVNAYSGQGLLTKMLSKKCRYVYGIEVQKSAHEKAEKIKTANMKNICGKVEDKLREVDGKIDLIVLDPARSGCQKSVLDEILTRKIETICYVSCNFSTLIRDIKILQKNYVIKGVKIFDMFPMTARLETLVIMEKKTI